MTTTEMSVEGAAESDPAPDSTDAADPLPVPSPVLLPEPPAETLPSIADGVERPLDPRIIPLEQLTGWFITGAVSLGLLVVLVIVFQAADLPGWLRTLLALLWLGGTVAGGWLSHRWPPIEHGHSSYKVDLQGIESRRGVLWRKVINVPRSRVQHTDVSQGPLERRYGLGTLVIYTAGTSYARVDLSGLDHATALRIRDHLLAGEGTDAV